MQANIDGATELTIWIVIMGLAVCVVSYGGAWIAGVI